MSEEQEVWCVRIDSYDWRRHDTERYRPVNEEDLVIDAKRLNEGKETIAIHPIHYERIKVSYTKVDKFDSHWFCTGVICE